MTLAAWLAAVWPILSARESRALMSYIEYQQATRVGRGRWFPVGEDNEAEGTCGRASVVLTLVFLRVVGRPPSGEGSNPRIRGVSWVSSRGALQKPHMDHSRSTCRRMCLSSKLSVSGLQIVLDCYYQPGRFTA